MSYKIKYMIIDHIVIVRFPNAALAQKFIADVKTKNLLQKFKLDARINSRFRA